MNLLATRRGRALLLGCLYFAEGAPIGWLWWALPTRLRAAGAPAAEVTALTAALALPWALKFLWAPLVDGLRGRRWGLRAWAVAAQLGMGLSLLPLLGGADLGAPAALLPLLLAHAVLAATQDVAVDGIAVRVLPPEERGSANGWMQLGMLAARGLFGGLALRAEAWIGFDGVVWALIGCVWAVAALLLLCAREPAAAVAELAAGAPWGRRLRQLAAALLGLVRSRRTLAGLAFALLAGAGFEAVGGSFRLALLDLGLSQEQVGDFSALPVIACMVAGALAGGYLADRVPRRRACAAAVLIVAGAVALLAVALLAGVRGAPLLALLGLVHLALGALTTSSFALFMDLSDPRAGATHFSAFMGATNLCEAGAVWAAGRLASLPAGGPDPASFAWAWLALAGISLLGLAALPWTRAAA
ncbi:MAG: MFS transporter [Planctomycetes bacterium]|nr:MFS transporter [Planctomycetota bacterium]